VTRADANFTDPFCFIIIAVTEFNFFTPLSIEFGWEVTLPETRRFTFSEKSYLTEDCNAETEGVYWGGKLYCADPCLEATVNDMACSKECAELCEDQFGVEAGVPNCANVHETLVWDCGYTSSVGPEYYQPFLDHVEVAGPYVRDPPPTSPPEGTSGGRIGTTQVC